MRSAAEILRDAQTIALVDVFRRPEFCADVGREAVAARDECTVIVHRREVA